MLRRRTQVKYDNHFLFSETYIGDFVKNIVKSDNTEADNLFDSILPWYQEYKTAWEMYEDIVLDSLGFIKTTDGVFRVLSAGVGNPVAVAYLLPEDTDLNSTAKGKYYAVDAVKAAKKNNVNWAIVTNGMEWRLYHTQEVSPYEFYFAVDLAEDFAAGEPSDSTRMFCKLFSSRAFLEIDGALPIDTWKEASAMAEETLRRKAEDILKELCYGLKENMGQDTFTDHDRKLIYNDAIVLLYRMLFFGYAESRNLLPVVQNDPDYNDSFFDLCKTAKRYCLESELLECGNDFDLWERLDTQLRIYVDKNYNGVCSQMRTSLFFVHYEGLLEYQLFIAKENISIILNLMKTMVSQLCSKTHIITVIYRKSWEIIILSFKTINKMILSS